MGAGGGRRGRAPAPPPPGAAPGPAPTSGAGGADGTAPPPAPSTRLLLVRHAVTDQTGPILSGRTAGIDLSEAGRLQAEVTAGLLSRLPVAAVYASPIERTVQTAGAIAARHGLAARALPGVMEADYGEWTGGRIADLALTDEWKVVQRSPSRARFPGGESIREMQARTVAAIEEVVDGHPGETVVVVSHADPIKAAVAHFCGMHLDLFQRLHISPASVTAFDFSNGASRGVILLACNHTGSIDEVLARAEPPQPARPEGGSTGG